MDDVMPLLLLGGNRASFVAQLIKNPPAMRKTWVQSLGCKDPLEKGKATLLHYSGLENSLGLYSPWRSQKVRHDWVTFTFQVASGSHNSTFVRLQKTKSDYSRVKSTLNFSIAQPVTSKLRKSWGHLQVSSVNLEQLHRDREVSLVRSRKEVPQWEITCCVGKCLENLHGQRSLARYSP